MRKVKALLIRNVFGEIPPNSEPSLWSWWSVRSGADLATNVRTRIDFSPPPEYPIADT